MDILKDFQLILFLKHFLIKVLNVSSLMSCILRLTVVGVPDSQTVGVERKKRTSDEKNEGETKASSLRLSP